MRRFHTNSSAFLFLLPEMPWELEELSVLSLWNPVFFRIQEKRNWFSKRRHFPSKQSDISDSWIDAFYFLLHSWYSIKGWYISSKFVEHIFHDQEIVAGKFEQPVIPRQAWWTSTFLLLTQFAVVTGLHRCIQISHCSSEGGGGAIFTSG